MLKKESLFIFYKQCKPSRAQTEASNQVGDQLLTEDISFSARLTAPAASISNILFWPWELFAHEIPLQTCPICLVEYSL